MTALHSHGRRCPTSGHTQVSRALRWEGTYNGNEMVVENANCNGHGGGLFEAVATSAGRVLHGVAQFPASTPFTLARTNAGTNEHAHTHTPFETESSLSAATQLTCLLSRTHTPGFAHAPQNKLSVSLSRNAGCCGGACDEDGVCRCRCRRCPRREARWEARTTMF